MKEACYGSGDPGIWNMRQSMKLEAFAPPGLTTTKNATPFCCKQRQSKDKGMTFHLQHYSTFTDYHCKEANNKQQVNGHDCRIKDQIIHKCLPDDEMNILKRNLTRLLHNFCFHFVQYCFPIFHVSPFALLRISGGSIFFGLFFAQHNQI